MTGICITCAVIGASFDIFAIHGAEKDHNNIPHTGAGAPADPCSTGDQLLLCR